jgi:hypothetical protein
LRNRGGPTADAGLHACPLRTTTAAALVWKFTPSLLRVLVTWVVAVRRLMKSASAICYVTS